MSGDVQPKKRKDKKRKKEDGTEQINPQLHSIPIINQNEDLNIHVHKDEGTGGGICAKIVFFFLFLALSVLIGLIITEHRGLTDLDAVDSESRFSQIFEGWIDNSAGHEHDDDDHIASSLEDDNHDEHNSEELDHDNMSEEDHEEEEEEEDVSDTQLDEGDESPEQNSPEDDHDEDVTEEDDEIVDDQDQDEEDEEQADQENDSNGNAEEDEYEEVEDSREEVEESKEEIEESREELEDDEEENQNISSDILPTSQEEPTNSEEAEAEEHSVEEANEDSPINEEQEAKDVDEEDNTDSDSNSRMVIKIGVGVALLVVAHVVLVRKWKTEPAPNAFKEQEPIPDLSRRNTIVVPPSLQEIEPDIDENGDEEYSDEEGDVDSEDEINEHKSAKSRYQDLRSTYDRSLTPESESEYQNKLIEHDYDEEEEDDEDVDDDEEEEEESESGENEEDGDEDLLKRLEAKYGKLEDDAEDSSWKSVTVPQKDEAEYSDSDGAEYDYENITNKDDWKIKDKIDEAQKSVQNNAADAIKLFDVLLQIYPLSPRSLYGKAQALDALADLNRSNDILLLAIQTYLHVLNLENVPDALFENAAQRCINRMRFIGHYKRAIEVHNKLITRFPEDPEHRNQLAVSYLTINAMPQARQVLEVTLGKHPDNGFALVHYGFILKISDNNLNESIIFLRKGIATKEPGVIDGRFYFHLGDALVRLGQKEEAIKVYVEGVNQKLFLSKYQRSLYNVPHLKSQSWWTKEETHYDALFFTLEHNWRQIRAEGLQILNENGLFRGEVENLKRTGDWKQFELFAQGKKNIDNCKRCPFTCSLIENMPEASDCKRGQTKFSVMHPGTHIWPHCGPTNCRLRSHLGLIVPAHTYIRVAEETRTWENGKVLIFDDSFEHEVWHNGTEFRLVLIVDVWHPELTLDEKRRLPAI